MRCLGPAVFGLVASLVLVLAVLLGAGLHQSIRARTAVLKAELCSARPRDALCVFWVCQRAQLALDV